MKIFDFEENIDVYIIDGGVFQYDFLIGLNIIKQLRLIQNGTLKISEIKKIEKTESINGDDGDETNTSKEMRNETISSLK